MVFERHNVKHDTYSDGRKLMQLKADPEVRFIFMDIRMPSINGIELCRALRKIYTKNTKFIALTAHVFPQEQEQLLEEGFDGVMLKPFRENDLLNRLNIAVDKPSAEISNGLADSLLDLSSLKVMTQGDDALLHTILVQFVEETVADLDKLAELFKSPEPAAVREVVHKLSGRTGQVGATTLSKALRGLEVRLVNGESPEKMEDDLRYAVAKVELLIEEVKQMAGPETAHLVK